MRKHELIIGYHKIYKTTNPATQVQYEDATIPVFLCNATHTLYGSAVCAFCLATTARIKQ